MSAFESVEGNRWRGQAFRDAVLTYLQQEGHADARRNPETPSKISDFLRSELSDIVGTPWTLFCRTRQALDLSTPLDLANSSADLTGNEFAAVVHARRGAPVAGAYVVMDLETFSRVLTEMNR